MSRFALLLCSVGAICNASVITTAGDARLASRELFHYYDIDTSMSYPWNYPCPSSKSLKGKGLPPPPKHPKSKKGTKHPKGCHPPKEPPPPKLPKSSKSYPLPGKGIAPPTKAPAPTKSSPMPSPNGNSTSIASMCSIFGRSSFRGTSFLSCLCSSYFPSSRFHPYR